MSYKVVLISGKMGSGKTTLAKSLKAQWESQPNRYAILINFADTIYEIHNFALGKLADAGFDVPKKDGKLLQLLGTEWGRATYGDDVWVDVCKARIDRACEISRGHAGGQYLFIVGDCRYPNELKAFPTAITVRLECEREKRKARCDAWRDNETHASEISLDGFEADFDLVFDTGETPVEQVVSDVNLFFFKAMSL